MGLKDFDISKIQSFKYDTFDADSKTPQQFGDGHSEYITDGIIGGRHGGTEPGVNGATPHHQHEHSGLDGPPLYDTIKASQTFIYNGYTVLGVEDPIQTKFIDGDNADWPSQIMIPGNIAGRTASQPDGVGSLGNPQTFTINHAAGEYTITGLQGEFGISEIDLLAEKSLPMNFWKNSIEGTDNYPIFDSYILTEAKRGSETHGTNYMYPTQRFFGNGSPDEQPGRFGPAQTGFTISGYGARTVEGNLVDNITENYTELVKNSGDMYQDFINKQTSLQLDSVYPWDDFTSFDSTLFEMGFFPGTRAVRIGSPFRPNTKPLFTEIAPQSNIKDLKSIKAGDFGGGGDGFDFEEQPKILHLYDSFILAGDDGSSYASKAFEFQKDFKWKSIEFSQDQLNNASAWANNTWNSMVNWALQGYDNSIIPTVNVVNSMRGRTLDAHTQAVYMSRKGVDESKELGSESALPGIKTVYDERQHLIPEDYNIDETKFDGTAPRLAFLYKSIILDSADSATFTTNLKDHLMKGTGDFDKYQIPWKSSLDHPQGTSTQGRKYNESQPYIAGREYGESAATTAPSQDPFKFFSKLTDKSSVFNVRPQGEDKLLEKTGFVETPPDNSILKTENFSSPSASVNIPIKARALGKTEGVLDGNQTIADLTQTTSELNTNIENTTDTTGLINRYSTLAYGALGADDSNDQNDPGGAKSMVYEETLRSPSEMNQTVNKELGGLGNPERTEDLLALSGKSREGDRAGARDIGKGKIYAIGRQGLVDVIGSADKDKVVSIDGKAVIHLDNGKILKGNKFVDQVNAIPYGERTGGANDKDVEDLDFIPLIFYDVWNEKSITFRGMNLGAITDTVTPSWEEQEYVGRPVKSHTYGGTERSISFDFDIYPKTRQEFPVLLEKLNYLVGLCYPNLDRFLRMNGPLIKITLGDILRAQTGFLNTLTVTFPDDSPWEIDKGLRFTKRINVQCEFTYIGGYIPVSTGKHYGLSWLNGQDYTAQGVKFEDYPNRAKASNPDEATSAIPGISKLFAEYGQDNVQ